MATGIEALIERWRGSHASFEVWLDLDPATTFEGVLDGPYIGPEAGVGFVLGGRELDCGLAVGGVYVELTPARGARAALLTDAYVELHVRELPAEIDVQGDTAAWGSTLADGRLARCALAAR